MSLLVVLKCQNFCISSKSISYCQNKSNMRVSSKEYTKFHLWSWRPTLTAKPVKVKTSTWDFDLKRNRALNTVGIPFFICICVEDTLYEVKMIWIASSGRALCYRCPHRRPWSVLYGRSSCQKADISWISSRKGALIKGIKPVETTHQPVWTIIQCHWLEEKT